MPAKDLLAEIEIRELRSPAEIRAAQELRFAVWEAEGVPVNRPELRAIADAHDDHGIHWGAFHDGALVGAARLCFHDKLQDAPDAEMFSGADICAPVASMNRLVVRREFRGCGIGSNVDELRIKKASELGAKALIATPINVEPRRRALEHRGFRSLGVIGPSIWSSSVEICAYFLPLEESSR